MTIRIACQLAADPRGGSENLWAPGASGGVERGRNEQAGNATTHVGQERRRGHRAGTRDRPPRRALQPRRGRDRGRGRPCGPVRRAHLRRHGAAVRPRDRRTPGGSGPGRRQGRLHAGGRRAGRTGPRRHRPRGRGTGGFGGRRRVRRGGTRGHRPGRSQPLVVRHLDQGRPADRRQPRRRVRRLRRRAAVGGDLRLLPRRDQTFPRREPRTPRAQRGQHRLHPRSRRPRGGGAHARVPGPARAAGAGRRGRDRCRDEPVPDPHPVRPRDRDRRRTPRRSLHPARPVRSS